MYIIRNDKCQVIMFLCYKDNAARERIFSKGNKQFTDIDKTFINSKINPSNKFSGFYQHFTYLLLSGKSAAESLDRKLLEFLKWVALANILAWPVAYYAMNKWLQNFAFRVIIGWEIFLVSAGAALVISVVTASYQSIKAAVANPVDSLRYE